MFQNFSYCLTCYGRYESLNENAIDSVLLHPFEVQIDSLFIGRTEKIGLAIVGVNEIDRIFFCVFGHVGPKFYSGISRFEFSVAAAVNVSVVSGVIAFYRKPSLITCHYQIIITWVCRCSFGLCSRV